MYINTLIYGCLYVCMHEYKLYTITRLSSCTHVIIQMYFEYKHNREHLYLFMLSYYVLLYTFLLFSAGDASFDGISTTKSEEKEIPGMKMGDWRSFGKTLIVYEGKAQIPSSNPDEDNLKYSLLLETHKDVSYSHIFMTFKNVVKGGCYSVSFYDKTLSGKKAPHEFAVLLGENFEDSEIVYEKKPTSAEKWVKVISNEFCVQSTNLHLRMRVISKDTDYRAIAIDDVQLNLRGIYELSKLCLYHCMLTVRICSLFVYTSRYTLKKESIYDENFQFSSDVTFVQIQSVICRYYYPYSSLP
jgi:hypothetical protein